MSTTRRKRPNTFHARRPADWRNWLAAHHDSEREVWLVFYKRHTGRPSLTYEEAVNEALCFGWVDSLIKRLDDDRYTRKFTPRKADSRWSTPNRKRYARLEASGRLEAAGRSRAPTSRSGDAPAASPSKLPRYIREALAEHPLARRFFAGLAPSYRLMYLRWIDSAKRSETRSRRLRQAIDRLAAGKKPGLT